MSSDDPDFPELVQHIDDQLKRKQPRSKLIELKREYETLKRRMQNDMSHVVITEIEPAEDTIKHLQHARDILERMQVAVNDDTPLDREGLQTCAYEVLHELSGNIDADLQTFVQTVDYAHAKTDPDAIRSDVRDCTGVLIERINRVIETWETRLESSRTRLEMLRSVVEIPASKFMSYDERVGHRKSKIQKMRMKSSESTALLVKQREQQRKEKREAEIERRRERARRLEAVVSRKKE